MPLENAIAGYLKINLFRVFISLNLLFSQSAVSGNRLLSGSWRGELTLNDTTILPFNFNVDSLGLEIINGEEHIRVTEISYLNDSVFIQLPVFNTEFRCRITGEMLNGFFLNHTRKSENIISFHAEHNARVRFSEHPLQTDDTISGRWQVVFDGEGPETKLAVGIFNQTGNYLSGTFLTPTGDYRYLEGEVSDRQLKLSAFDGSHAFLFTAEISDKNNLHGHFFSGMHWHDTWAAWRDEDAVQPDAGSLTFLKPGYNKIDFNFPDENGKMMSGQDPRFKNKVLIIQLMGSWCPNCMDETRFLSRFYKSMKGKGLEIVALDFEKVTDSAAVWKSIRRVKEYFDVEYPILFAGSADKPEASKTLPMLNRVLAFPTLIITDRQGLVKMIHTGFNGPATGNESEHLMDYIDNFVWGLIKQ